MCSFKLGGAFPLEARSKENRYYLSLKEEETSTRLIYLLIHLTPTRSEYLLCARPMTVTRKHGWVRISSFPPGHLWTKARRMGRSRREKRWPAQGPVAGEQQRWDEKEVSWSPSQRVSSTGLSCDLYPFISFLCQFKVYAHGFPQFTPGESIRRLYHCRPRN